MRAHAKLPEAAYPLSVVQARWHYVGLKGWSGVEAAIGFR